jgi:sugar phosphate isomerase/epimerase
MRMSRRDFLGGSTAAVTAAGILSAAAETLRADPLGWPVGCQVFPVGKMLAKDFEGTLREIAGIGYQTIEMCSPPGYVNYGFAPLAGLKADEIRRMITGAGLRCESCHYTNRELRESLAERIAFAKDLGLKQMVISGFELPRPATLDHWRKACDEANQFGERITGAGLDFGFHNHHFEFQKIDGVLIYDELLRRLDPKLVKMQFQVGVVSLGYHAADYLAKYPGRFLSLHLQDWSAEEKKQAPVGQGAVDWPKTFAAAKAAGVKNYFVELGMEAMKTSYAYLHSLKV